MNSFWLIEDYIFANDLRFFDRAFQKNVKSLFLKSEKKRKIRILEHCLWRRAVNRGHRGATLRPVPVYTGYALWTTTTTTIETFVLTYLLTYLLTCFRASLWRTRRFGWVPTMRSRVPPTSARPRRTPSSRRSNCTRSSTTGPTMSRSSGRTTSTWRSDVQTTPSHCWATAGAARRPVVVVVVVVVVATITTTTTTTVIGISLVQCVSNIYT